MTLLPHHDSERGWRNLLYGLTAVTVLIYLVRAFATPFTIQDDARQFMAWMPRLMTRDALPGDLLADYWQSVSPPVYRLPFEFFALLGVDPLTVARLLPVLLLAVAAWAAWQAAMRLTGKPAAAFVAAAAVMALVIHEDSIYTASPRAFSPPLFLLFLNALLREWRLTIIVTLFLLASIYPTTALIGITMLGLSRIHRHPRWHIDLSYRSVVLVGAAAAAILVAIVPFPTQTRQWEPTLTLEQALEMPNLGSPDGRSSLVGQHGAVGWICSARMGFFPEIIPCGRGIPLDGAINMLLLVPLILLGLRAAIRKGPREPGGGDLVYLWALIAAIGWYVVAVLLAFRLHLPSRYSQRVLSIMEWLAIGQIIGLWLHAKLAQGRLRGAAAAAAALLAGLFLFSFATPLPGLRQPSDEAALTRIAHSPPGTVVAGVSEDLDFVPALTGRSALATTEHAIPYHIGYFRPLSERLGDSLLAAATPDRSALAAFVRRYGVDLFVVERALIEEGRVPPRYATIVPDAARHAETMLARGPSALQALAPACTVHSGALVLLDAPCLAGE